MKSVRYVKKCILLASVNVLVASFVLAKQELFKDGMVFQATIEGGNGDSLSALSHDSDEYEVAVSIAGNDVAPVNECKTVLLSPKFVVFPELLVGLATTQSIEIANKGMSECIVILSLIESTEFDLASGQPDLFTLAPGQMQAIQVVYTPTDVGDDAGTLEITSGDPNEPQITINLMSSAQEQESADTRVSHLGMNREFVTD